MPRKARHTDLQRNIIDFCRVLREREMLVTPSEVIDAIRTADAVDLSDRQEFKTALRSVLTARPEDIPVHDATFDEFWRTRLPDRFQEERGEEGIASEDPNAQGEEMPQPQVAEGERAEEEVHVLSLFTARPENIPVHDATSDEFWRTRLNSSNVAS